MSSSLLRISLTLVVGLVISMPGAGAVMILSDGHASAPQQDSQLNALSVPESALVGVASDHTGTPAPAVRLALTADPSISIAGDNGAVEIPSGWIRIATAVPGYAGTSTPHAVAPMSMDLFGIGPSSSSLSDSMADFLSNSFADALLSFFGPPDDYDNYDLYFGGYDHFYGYYDEYEGIYYEAHAHIDFGESEENYNEIDYYDEDGRTGHETITWDDDGEYSEYESYNDDGSVTYTSSYEDYSDPTYDWSNTYDESGNLIYSEDYFGFDYYDEAGNPIPFAQFFSQINSNSNGVTSDDYPSYGGPRYYLNAGFLKSSISLYDAQRYVTASGQIPTFGAGYDYTGYANNNLTQSYHGFYNVPADISALNVGGGYITNYFTGTPTQFTAWSLLTSGRGASQLGDLVGNLRLDQVWGGSGLNIGVYGGQQGDNIFGNVPLGQPWGWAVNGGMRQDLPWPSSGAYYPTLTTDDSSAPAAFSGNRAFLPFAGAAGLTESFYDFYSVPLGYSQQLGNGYSATMPGTQVNIRLDTGASSSMNVPGTFIRALTGTPDLPVSGGMKPPDDASSAQSPYQCLTNEGCTFAIPAQEVYAYNLGNQAQYNFTAKLDYTTSFIMPTRSVVPTADAFRQQMTLPAGAQLQMTAFSFNGMAYTRFLVDTPTFYPSQDAWKNWLPSSDLTQALWDNCFNKLPGANSDGNGQFAAAMELPEATIGIARKTRSHP
jgi:hypothetical protein